MDYLNNLFVDKEKEEYVKKYFKNIDTNEQAYEVYKLVIKYVDISNLEDFIKITKNVLNSKEFQRRLEFAHHGEETVVEHSIKVAALAYKIAKHFNIDTKNVSLIGLMHDMYSTPWQDNKIKHDLRHAHGFVHAKVALENCKKYYPTLMNEKIEDGILRHMFPLNIRRPKYKEGWLIVFCDKCVSMSIFKDVKHLPSYAGIKIFEKS